MSRCCRLSRGELHCELPDGAVEGGPQLIVQLLLLRKPPEQVRVTRLDELVQFDLEHAEVRYRDVVEIPVGAGIDDGDRKSTRLNSSHTVISYAVFCLKKKKKRNKNKNNN